MITYNSLSLFSNLKSLIYKLCLENNSMYLLKLVYIGKNLYLQYLIIYFFYYSFLLFMESFK